MHLGHGVGSKKLVNSNSVMIVVRRMAKLWVIIRCLLGLASVSFLVACTPVSKVTPVSSADIQASVKAKEMARQREELQANARQQARQLREFLSYAQLGLAEDRLMLSKFDNAYYWYRQALSIDELNAEAHWGMQQITERYLVLAQQAYSSGRLELAEQMLSGAEKIAAPPAKVNALREKYRQSVNENEFLLPGKELAAKSERIKRQLDELARSVETDQRLLIVARNDSEGRWIYKQMRDAVKGFRLRGNIELGRVPRIVIIDL